MATRNFTRDGARVGAARQVGRKIWQRARALRDRIKFGDELKQHLTAGAFKIISRIDWLEACSRRDRPHAAPLVQCRQSELAHACGIGREAVNRLLIDWLEPLGLVKVIRRNPLHGDGRFRTHMYELTAIARRLLGLAVRTAPPRPSDSRVMYTSHGTVGTYALDPGAAYASSNRPPQRR